MFKQCSVGSGSVWQWQCQWQCSVTHFLFFSDITSKILVDFAIFFIKIRKRMQNFVKIVLMMTVCVNHDCCSNKTSSMMEFVPHFLFIFTNLTTLPKMAVTGSVYSGSGSDSAVY